MTILDDIYNKQQLIEQYQSELDSDFVKVASGFNENFYFNIEKELHEAEGFEAITFSFYIPSAYDYSHVDTKLHHSVKIEFLMNHGYNSDDTLYHAQWVSIKKYSMDDKKAVYLMHPQLHSRALTTHGISRHHLDVSLIDFIKDASKNIIVPYIENLDFKMNGKILTYTHDTITERAQEYLENMDFIVNTLNTTFSDDTGSEIQILKNAYQNYQTKMTAHQLSQALPNKGECQKKRYKL